MDDKIEAVAKIDQEYRSGEITRREAVQRLHMFVLDLAPGSLPGVEEVDTNELMKACEDIIAAYDAPARKARMEAKLAEAREALNRPEVQKLLTLQNLKKRACTGNRRKQSPLTESYTLWIQISGAGSNFKESCWQKKRTEGKQTGSVSS